MGLVIRWTVGDVSPEGFDALALSIRGARNIFGDSASYIVCVNTTPVDDARRRVGSAADQVEWFDSTHHFPQWLLPHVDAGLAQGVAWKFAAVAAAAGDHVLSLDNDLILWRKPPSVAAWLNDRDSLLIAEDVRACYGQFAHLCPPEPRNSGMVGLPPFFGMETHVRGMLERTGVRLSAETDEQGLQVALVTSRRHRVVSLREVSISGYFRPHMLELGSCGAHFVGVNVRDNEPARGFWYGCRPEVERRLRQASRAKPMAGSRIA
jgi:hypothetical protein